jgi:DHA1 family multidrug resistance protein B-like MFS transporter
VAFLFFRVTMLQLTTECGLEGGIIVKFKDFHKNVKIRIYVFFAFGTVQSTTLPFMAVYFAEHFGSTTTGILLAASIIGGIISGAFGGYYADRIGRRKLMILAEIVFLLSYLLMAVANSSWIDSPTLTFVAFFLTNACWGVYGPADEAMLLDVTDSNSRPLMYSVFYWVHNLTMAIGASIGAIMFKDYRFELFLTMSIVVLISLAATVLLIEETYKPSPDALAQKHLQKGLLQNYADVLKDTTFMLYLLAGTMLMSLEFQLSNYIGIRLANEVGEQQIHFFKDFVFSLDGIKLLGFLQTENTILVVLFAALAARWAKKFQDRSVLFVCILMLSLGYSVMTFSNSLAVLFIAMLVATIGEVASVPIRQSYLGDIAPEHGRSSYIAVNGMTFSASRILASIGVIVGSYLSSVQMGILSFLIGMASFILFRAIVPAVHERRESTARDMSLKA